MVGEQRPLAEKLDEKLDKTGDCWVYRNANTSNGYAHMGVSYDPFTKQRYPRARYEYAHRIAWALHHGRWPEESMVVRHTCDNPACCNPEHLIEGTQQQNVDDRSERSDWQPTRKLTPEQVEYARSSHGTQLEVARELGVSQATISRLRLGANYSTRPRRNPHRKLTEEQVREIRASDRPFALGKSYGVAPMVVAQIRDGLTYKDVL